MLACVIQRGTSEKVHHRRQNSQCFASFTFTKDLHLGGAAKAKLHLVNDHFKTAELLKVYGSDITEIDELGNSVLHKAILNFNRQSAFRALVG